MKKNKKVLVLFTISLICIGIFCIYQSYSHKEIEIKNELLKNCQNGKLSIKNIDINHTWDSILLIKPYDDVEKYHIQMTKADKRTINTYTTFDSTCTVLFLSQGKLVAYASVSRNEVIDFATTNKIKYARTEVFAVMGNKVYDLEK